jgi:hypothetical protein
MRSLYVNRNRTGNGNRNCHSHSNVWQGTASGFINGLVCWVVAPCDSAGTFMHFRNRLSIRDTDYAFQRHRLCLSETQTVPFRDIDYAYQRHKLCLSETQAMPIFMQ